MGKGSVIPAAEGHVRRGLSSDPEDRAAGAQGWECQVSRYFSHHRKARGVGAIQNRQTWQLFHPDLTMEAPDSTPVGDRTGLEPVCSSHCLLGLITHLCVHLTIYKTFHIMGPLSCREELRGDLAEMPLILQGEA